MISFVIPAHNEESVLAQTITALHAAGRAASRDYEIIVADDDSTDRTAQVARAAGASVTSVRLRHIAAVRNAGARASRGDILFFIDADTVVPPDSVREALAALDSGAIGAGAAARFDGHVPRYARLMLAFTIAVFRLLKYTGGCFLCCRRADFESAGGWDERFYAGEEIHMVHALKRLGRFVVVRTPVVTSGRKLRTHSPREILGTVLRLLLRPSSTRRREALHVWYGPRRPDRPRP